MVRDQKCQQWSVDSFNDLPITVIYFLLHVTVRNVVTGIYNSVISGEDFCKKYTLSTRWSCIPVMFKRKWTLVLTLQKKPSSHECQV